MQIYKKKGRTISSSNDIAFWSIAAFFICTLDKFNIHPFFFLGFDGKRPVIDDIWNVRKYNEAKTWIERKKRKTKADFNLNYKLS